MLAPNSLIEEYAPEQVLVLDTETTGFSETDEIIQLSAVDGYYREIINTYLKPANKAEWPGAEAVNHISPAMVQNCKTMDQARDQLQYVINQFKVIVGYNIGFDIRMLRQSGLSVAHMKVIDVMPLYVAHYGVFRRGRKTAKLVEAAEHYGYTYGAHDSLEDVKATLVVLENLMREGLVG